MKSLFRFALLVLLIGHATYASDNHVFVSKEHEFSVQYPKSWTPGEVVHAQTTIRVESPDGDDFNITVVEDAALRDMTPKEYVGGMMGQVDNLVTNILSRNYPDATLIEKGKTQLSQQPALYYVMDYTLSAAGRNIPMRSYAISTKHGSKQYTLTFRTPKQFYLGYLPTIQRLALGFQFTKTRIDE